MKMIHILRRYMKGIRLSALVLTVMMAWAILNGVVVYGKVQNIGADIQILKSGAAENAGVLMYFPTGEDLTTGAHTEGAETLEKLLEGEDIVEDVFTVRVANPVSYGESGISIVLYEPEMLAFFPGLKKYGIDFKNEADGCILASELFGGLHSGDTIELDFGKKSAAFSVAGRMTTPYRRIALSSAATNPYAHDLFSDGQAVIMQATDGVMERLNALARRIECDTNLIVAFAEDSTAEEREALIAAAAPGYLYFPLERLIENSEQEVAATLKEKLAQPIFLAVSSAVAYLSIVILTLKKKEKDTAILYLCGCSRKKCAAIQFAVFQTFALVPVLLNVLFILIWPNIHWEYGHRWVLEQALEKGPDMMNEQLFFTLISLFSYFETITINTSCLSIVFGYYLCAAAISLAVLAASMARHTPMTYLRGASR